MTRRSRLGARVASTSQPVVVIADPRQREQFLLVAFYEGAFEESAISSASLEGRRTRADPDLPPGQSSSQLRRTQRSRSHAPSLAGCATARTRCVVDDLAARIERDLATRLEQLPKLRATALDA